MSITQYLHEKGPSGSLCSRLFWISMVGGIVVSWVNKEYFLPRPEPQSIVKECPCYTPPIDCYKKK